MVESTKDAAVNHKQEQQEPLVVVDKDHTTRTTWIQHPHDSITTTHDMIHSTTIIPNDTRELSHQKIMSNPIRTVIANDGMTNVNHSLMNHHQSNHHHHHHPNSTTDEHLILPKFQKSGGGQELVTTMNNNHHHHYHSRRENTTYGMTTLIPHHQNFQENSQPNSSQAQQDEQFRMTSSTVVDVGGLVVVGSTNHETPMNVAVSNVKAEKKDHRKHKRLKKTLQDQHDHDNDPTENDIDLVDDLHFTPDELEMLKSDHHVKKKNPQDQENHSSSSSHSISHSYEATRPRLTIEQQQHILVSLHALNLNEMQRKELRLLGDVMQKITQDEMFKCTTFESVNIYLFILIISATASALGTLALALIYFIVFRGSIAEAIFSAAISGVFVVSIISCVGVCVFYNLKNRPKNKKQKAAIAHYHEIVEEAIYNIGTRFFPDFEIEFDYLNGKQDANGENALEERKRRLERARRNRHKKLLSRFYRQQIQIYLSNGESLMNLSQPQHNNQASAAQKRETHFENPLTPTTDTMWYSVCCIFGGFCTLIIVLILILFSFICLFFPLIFKRPPIVPIFITIPIQVGYGVVAAMVLAFFIFLCFFSCTLYCYAFAGKENSNWKCLCCSLETTQTSHYSNPIDNVELGNVPAVRVIENV